MSSSLQQLKFEPFTTVISPSFWLGLARKKLNTLKLDSSELVIWAYYQAGSPSKGARLYINEESLLPHNEDAQSATYIERAF